MWPRCGERLCFLPREGGRSGGLRGLLVEGSGGFGLVWLFAARRNGK